MIECILYHRNCVDGAMAAWIAREHHRRLGHPVELVPVQYNDKIELSLLAEYDDCNITIVDFSIPIDKFIELHEKANPLDVTYIDHHKGGEEHLKAAEQWMLSKGHSHTVIYETGPGICGATLAYDLFKGRSIDAGLMTFANEVVDYVADYDTWVHQYPESMLFNACAQIRIGDPSNWDALFNPDYFRENVERGRIVRDYIDSMVAKYTVPKYYRWVNYDGSKGVVVQCNSELRNDVGDTILNQSEEVDFVVIYWCSEDKWTFSIRSREGFDANALASQFGGGGHGRAAAIGIHRHKPWLLAKLEQTLGFNI